MPERLWKQIKIPTSNIHPPSCQFYTSSFREDSHEEMGNASSLKHHLETAEKTGVIQLSKANLKELPKDLLAIAGNLRTLDLNNNRLQQVSDSIGLFKSLKILNFSYNRIKTVSAHVADLSKLETFLISNNLVEDLPMAMAKLDALKTVNLANNRLRSFPIALCTLKSLEFLDLSSNEIESLPDQIGSCNANEINLNNNKIRELKEALTKCARLKILRLDNNQVDLGSITRPILADSKLCLLSVENNPFTLKQLQDKAGYEDYIERYTSTKRKMF